MVRSSFIVVSDDQMMIQNAQQFGQMHGVTVQVMTPEQWASQQMRAEAPVLTPGQGVQVGQGVSEGAKVLPFPGMGGMVAARDPRSSVATINHMESVAIENAIAAFRGNLTEAAKALGIGRATLYRKVKQYKLDPSNARKKKAA